MYFADKQLNPHSISQVECQFLNIKSASMQIEQMHMQILKKCCSKPWKLLPEVLGMKVSLCPLTKFSDLQI